VLANALVVALALAAPPRLVIQVESVQEGGLYPNPLPDPEAPPGEQVDPSTETLFRWTLLPMVEGRFELPDQDFRLRYNPRLLMLGNPSRFEGPIFLHRGSANHVWRFVSGGDLESNFFVESGEQDIVWFVQDVERDQSTGFVPPARIVVSDRIGGSTAVSLATGDSEFFTLGFRGEYFAPRDDTEDAILASYELGMSVDYEHFLFRKTYGVFTTRLRHVDFFEEDRQTRVADLQVGIRWTQLRTLEWRFTGGAQLSIGDRRPDLAVEDEPNEVQRTLSPAAKVLADWSFIRLAEVSGSLLTSVGIGGFVDQTTGSYIPQINAGLGLRVVQPWGDFNLNGAFGTPLEEQEDDSLLPTFYEVNARLTMPASAYVGFYFGGRVSQRAPRIGADDFRFTFLNAVGEVGVRLWWSSGRDPRLPRPSEKLDTRGGG